MSEFVKKTIVGYKDVPGGSSDPDCTHVILTLNEYKKIVRERDEAIRTVGIERQNADRQMNEEKKNAAYQIRQVRDQAVKEIAEMQGALAQAQKDVAYQRHLNENLLRISRERANVDRGLKPKKEHTGYVVMNMQEKKLQRKNSRGYYTITLWETVLQSPYSVDFTEEQARYQIHEDLMQHEDGKEWALSRIGICEKPDPKFCDPFEYNEIMENENVLVRYQLRANYQARRGGEDRLLGHHIGASEADTTGSERYEAMRKAAVSNSGFSNSTECAKMPMLPNSGPVMGRR